MCIRIQITTFCQLNSYCGRFKSVKTQCCQYLCQNTAFHDLHIGQIDIDPEIRNIFLPSAAGWDCLMKHPFSCRNDQTGFLQQRNKFYRRDTLPADCIFCPVFIFLYTYHFFFRLSRLNFFRHGKTHQCLCTDQPACLCVHDWLIISLKSLKSMIYCMMKLACDLFLP